MAIDANLEAMEEDGVFDIFGYMKKLRQARRGLVELLVNFLESRNQILIQNVKNVSIILHRNNTSLSTIL